MLIAFQGKGTSIGWDLGVAEALLDSTDERVDQNQMVFSGNSSGSISAALFSCQGITKESIARSKLLLSKFPVDAVGSNNREKALEMIRDIPSEKPHSNLEPLIQEVTDNGRCQPRFPALIIAANLEVVDQRTNRCILRGRTAMFRSAGTKTIDYGTFTVSECGSPIGKACTYFVDRTLFEKLSKIPANERLCDIRLMENAADLRLAILASVSEPTYFPPIADPNPSKIRSGFPIRGNRIYNGGFPLFAAGQDLKRVYPGAQMYGTGHVKFPKVVNRIVSARYLIDLHHILYLSDRTLDLSLSPTEREWETLTSLSVSDPIAVQMGYSKAQQMLRR